MKDVIETAVEKFEDLIVHDFIAKQQSEYLQYKKDSLPKETVIILMDFSMNETCTIQESIRSDHWRKR